MPFLFFWSLFEIFLFFVFSEKYGFFRVFIAYMLPSFLGSLIFSNSGKFTLSQLQTQFFKDEAPPQALMRVAAYYLSGIFFLIPSFSTRVVGIILWIPFVGSFILKFMFKKAAHSTGSHFKVFMSGVGPTHSSYDETQYSYTTKDVEVTYRDVTPQQPEKKELPPPIDL